MERERGARLKGRGQGGGEEERRGDPAHRPLATARSLQLLSVKAATGVGGKYRRKILVLSKLGLEKKKKKIINFAFVFHRWRKTASQEHNSFIGWEDFAGCCCFFLLPGIGEGERQ